MPQRLEKDRRLLVVRVLMDDVAYHAKRVGLQRIHHHVTAERYQVVLVQQPTSIVSSIICKCVHEGKAQAKSTGAVARVSSACLT